MTNKNYKAGKTQSWAWWYVPVVLVLIKQKAHVFKANLVYTGEAAPRILRGVTDGQTMTDIGKRQNETYRYMG